MPFLSRSRRPGLLLLLPLLLAAFGPAAPRPDFAGLYRDGPRLLVDTRREGDSLRLYLGLPSAKPYPVRLSAWAGYEARQPLWQDSLRHLRRRRALDGRSWVSGCVLASRLPAGTVLRLESAPVATAETYQEAATTAWLTMGEEQLSRSFVLTDSAGRPLGRRYVRTGEAIGVATFGLETPVRWQRYGVNASAALPPMTDPARQPAAPRLLPVLDSGRVAARQLMRPGSAGLYALRAGGSQKLLPLLVADNAFPAQTTPQELIQPLIYLTTGQERQRLSNAADPKRAIDKFWLDAAGGDKTKARELIRRYYGRVTAANRLFSAHKPGWLTDRGLLYVVLGPPESVRRLATGEERWFYTEPSPDSPPVTFSFRPKPSTFAPDYYELIRRPEYEELWFAAVEQWRKGTTDPTDR